MPLIETIKEKVEKITGWGRPKRREVEAVLRPRKPNVFRFADDGIVPNNSKLLSAVKNHTEYGDIFLG
jgi:hypothetical protein